MPHAARQPWSWLIFDVGQNKMRFCVFITFLVCGCAHLERPLTPTSIAGSYSNHDGFWPRTLALHTDGSFTYDQLTDVLQEKKDGSMVFEGSWGMRGSWSFQPPDRIELISQPRKDRVTIFVRRNSAGRIALLEPNLYPDILKTWIPSSQSTFASEFLTR